MVNELNKPQCETVHSMLRRLSGWDYKGRAIYQITLTLADRASEALGRVVVANGRGGWVGLEAAKGLGLKPEEVEARVELSALGEAILAHWKRLGEFTPEIKPLYCEIMPDHLHGILEVTRPMARPLGNAIGGFKTGCEKIYARLAPRAQDRGLTPRARGESRATGAGLWSPGYQDTVLLHEGQLANMFNYLRDNARRRAVKALFPDLFKVVGELKVTLKGRACPVPTAQAVGYFSALGNRFLLARPLAQVQCSRSFFRYKRVPKPGGGLKIARNAQGEPIIESSTLAFEEKKRLLLAAAKKGQVLISPCVSDGERQIAREALLAGLPLITLQNKGFSKLQKPSGRYFDACSAGRLLMLAPAAWPYLPGDKPMTRDDATAMNRLCQWIVGENAAEINYHGAQPANVDALAKAAARVL